MVTYCFWLRVIRRQLPFLLIHIDGVGNTEWLIGFKFDKRTASPISSRMDIMRSIHG